MSRSSTIPKCQFSVLPCLSMLRRSLRQFLSRKFRKAPDGSRSWTSLRLALSTFQSRENSHRLPLALRQLLDLGVKVPRHLHMHLSPQSRRLSLPALSKNQGVLQWLLPALPSPREQSEAIQKSRQISSSSRDHPPVAGSTRSQQILTPAIFWIQPVVPRVLNDVARIWQL